MLDMPVPQASRSESSRRISNQLIGRSTFKSADMTTIALTIDKKVRIKRALGRAMIISREAEGEQFQSDSFGWLHSLLMRIINLNKRTFESILYICCIIAVFHPDTLFQTKCITQAVQKTRNIALEPNRVKVGIPLRINCPILILADAKLASPAIEKEYFFIDFGYKTCMRNRRTQRIYE